MLINYESPLERNLYLDLDSDNAGGGEEGQDLEPVADSVMTEEISEPEYFYSYESDDGNKADFKDAKELNEYIRSGTLRHADYTRKTQDLASQRKSLEAEKAKYEAESTTFLQQRQEYEKIEKYLKSLPPEVYSRLKEGIRNQPRQAQTDPRVEQLIKDNEERAKRAEEESMRQAAFDSLSKEYSDFDKESIMQAVKQLEEIPPGDQMRAFMKLLYEANKGRMSPAQMEQAATEALKRKQSVTTPMTSTNSTPGKGIKIFTSFDEAAEAAHNNL